MNLNQSSLQCASGAIPYGMTNDYMFRAVLQSNQKVLRGLICSLLHYSEKEIISMNIMNPIILGEAVESKEIRLDINILLNNRTLINLEMQITNRLNWQNRSVIYLCRSYDSLTHGQDYSEAKSVVHVGFLNYTLFIEYPEFCATYKLSNVKNHQKYSDNITLNVVNLSRIDLATEEDKQYHIDEWAAFMKATTWEELRMLASKDEYLNEAAETIFRLSADERIRKRCRDREEYYEDLHNYEMAILDRDFSIASYRKAVIERESMITEQKNVLAKRESVIAEQQNMLARHESVIIEQEKLIQERDTQIQSLLREIEQLQAKN